MTNEQPGGSSSSSSSSEGFENALFFREEKKDLPPSMSARRSARVVLEAYLSSDGDPRRAGLGVNAASRGRVAWSGEGERGRDGEPSEIARRVCRCPCELSSSCRASRVAARTRAGARPRRALLLALYPPHRRPGAMRASRSSGVSTRADRVRVMWAARVQKPRDFWSAVRHGSNCTRRDVQ